MWHLRSRRLVQHLEWLTRQEYINSYRDLKAEFAEPSVVLAAQAEKWVSVSLVMLNPVSECLNINQHV
jgi:hypothetical protein